MTTTNITAVSVSMRKAQEMSSSPLVIQRSIATCAVSWPKPTRQNTIHDRMQETISAPVVMISEGRGPERAAEKPDEEPGKAGQEHDGRVDHKIPLSLSSC